jgi:hypothetical protein
LSDAAFASALARISGDGSIKFTLDHVYYEIVRVVARKSRILRRALRWGGVLVLLGMAANGLFNDEAPRIGWILWGIGVVLLAILWRRGRFAHPSPQAFQILWKRWTDVHGAPPGLIVRKDKDTASAPVAKAPDLAHYSFDRAVICDRDETVDLLLANQFHFENNCAVLSKNGYPPGPFTMVREMLRKNPRLKVYALHDASPSGCRLAYQLATRPEWFAGTGVLILDVGLRPQHARKERGFYQRASDTLVKAGAGIATGEIGWLTSQRRELAAIPPEQILKRLYVAMGRPEDEIAKKKGKEEPDDFEIDDLSFSADADDGFGGDDGFG